MTIPIFVCKHFVNYIAVLSPLKKLYLFFQEVIAIKSSYKKVKISPFLFLMVLAFILFRNDDLHKIIPAVCAVFIHELGHIAAALVLKLPIKCITLDIFGASIEAKTFLCSYKKEAVLSLSGPLTNIISAGFILLFPMRFNSEYFVVSSIVFAAVNLLPAKDFDGGRILFCILVSFCSLRTTSKIMLISSFICTFLLWCASIYFLMRTGAYLSLFIFSAALFAKLFISEDISSTNFKE